MIVINETSKRIVAYGWISEGGHGDDILIDPGSKQDVWGPKTDKTGNLCITGTATIIEGTPTKSWFYGLAPEQILPIPSDESPAIGITVFYYEGD